MLEYAYLSETNNLIHISEVKTGKDCGCICPQCKDTLTAKNRIFEGRKKDIFFAQQNYEETRSCLMTQLHLAAQDHFLKLDTFILPHYSFRYLNELVTQPPRKIKIKKAVKEYSVNKYFADVMLDTDIGNVYIEIAVTHKNTEEKNLYYKNNKLISLEYDLGNLITLPVKDAIQEMVNNSELVRWIFGWDEDRLIADKDRRYAEMAEVEAKKTAIIAKVKEQDIENEPRRNRESAQHDSTKRKREKYLTVPNYYADIQYSIGKDQFSKYTKLISEQKVIFDSVEDFIFDNNEYFVLKATRNGNVVYLVYVYEYGFIPNFEVELNDAVLIRNPTSIALKKKQCSWKWLNNPKADRKRQSIINKAVELYKLENQYGLKLDDIELEVGSLADHYQYTADLSSPKKFLNWRSYLIQNGLFNPSLKKKNPSHPYLFKQNKYHPYLWMFNEWYFLVLTKFIEIIDNLALNTPIDLEQVFEELSFCFGLHPKYIEIKNSPFYQYLESSYVSRENTIKSCLDLFEPLYIKSDNGKYERIGELSKELKFCY